MKDNSEKIIYRLLAPTPKFWKNVRSVMLSGLSFCLAILAYDKVEPGVLPEAVIQIAKYGSAISTICALQAQLAKK